MKKMLVSAIVFLFAVILFLLYIIYFGNTPKATEDCSTVVMNYEGEEWESNISINDAKQIAGNYRNDYGKNRIWIGETRGDDKHEDARCAWFPLETIKRYIWSIEASNCKKQCKDSLGLRIYYAKYPDISDAEFWSGSMESQKAYASYHTVFMVPTYFTGSFHQDFNPFSEECHQVLDEVPGPHKSTKALLSVGDEQNHGSLIPPNAPDGAFFIR